RDFANAPNVGCKLRNTVLKMKKRKILISLISIFLIAIGVLYFGGNFAPGSYPYAEIYKVDFPEENVSQAIKDFKNQNPDFKVPNVKINNNGEFDLEEKKEDK